MKAYPKQFIAGQWREGGGGGALTDFNPYTGKEIYSYRSASAGDIDEAYTAAAKAQKEWAKTPPGQKRAALESLLKAFIDAIPDVYACLLEEDGAVKAKADLEVFVCQDIIREAMAFPMMMDGRIIPSNMPGKENYVFRMPRGVVGTVAPWNFPFILTMRSVVPALATGNGVVLKPSSDSPASAFCIAEIIEKSGAFPPGLFNAVAGKGSEIGDSVVNHPVPRIISFTGSTAVGKRIGEVAGAQLKDVSLELGGNNVMIVLEDADISRAAKAAAFGSNFNAGQVCMALNRIIVMDSVRDRFVEAFVEETKHLKAGDPADPEVFIGPIINKEQVKNVEGFIRGSVKAGAKTALEGKTDGNVIFPWIFTDAANDMPASRNEVFGPVCSVISVKSEAEAVAVANDTEYGLSGSIFTEDRFHGMVLARQIDTGMVHINDQSINDESQVMFGGVKASGIGRFNAQWVVDKFTVDHWISVQREHRF
ncbi:MAG: aldehyde dehydrogenase family protein [Spirochaetaceae bacterium]|jgi:aldehyde dehydrogenase (NAD+)|nr:aldehyde dehydrogenase family protein [Spirochaetaceae bacterium]